MELRLPLEMSPGREAACRAVFGTWGFFQTMHGKKWVLVLDKFGFDAAFNHLLDLTMDYKIC